MARLLLAILLLMPCPCAIKAALKAPAQAPRPHACCACHRKQNDEHPPTPLTRFNGCDCSKSRQALPPTTVTATGDATTAFAIIPSTTAIVSVGTISRMIREQCDSRPPPTYLTPPLRL